MQPAAREVLVDDHLLGYISSLVRKTRQWPTFSLGASPRAGVAILRRRARSRRSKGGRIAARRRSGRTSARLAPSGDLDARGRGRGPLADELLTELIRSVEVPLR